MKKDKLYYSEYYCNGIKFYNVPIKGTIQVKYKMEKTNETIEVNDGFIWVESLFSAFLIINEWNKEDGQKFYIQSYKKEEHDVNYYNNI